MLIIYLRSIFVVTMGIVGTSFFGRTWAYYPAILGFLIFNVCPDYPSLC